MRRETLLRFRPSPLPSLPSTGERESYRFDAVSGTGAAAGAARGATGAGAAGAGRGATGAGVAEPGAIAGRGGPPVALPTAAGLTEAVFVGPPGAPAAAPGRWRFSPAPAPIGALAGALPAAPGILA